MKSLNDDTVLWDSMEIVANDDPGPLCCFYLCL
jgi:hypothetical protein